MTFSSPVDVREGLAAVDYLADDAIATTVYLAAALGKPLLVEGPAGVGKTELAKAVAAITEARLV
ncbi:MoxR family ATPase, partial [Actinoallomurus sp. NPDC052308]